MILCLGKIPNTTVNHRDFRKFLIAGQCDHPDTGGWQEQPESTSAPKKPGSFG
jgi:hypothetical protein